jgi:chorismate synthase
MNSIGNVLRITSFGESHGKVIGVVVDGYPAGYKVDLEYIQSELDRRRPGQSLLTTTRDEKDRLVVLSGIFNCITTGAPICMLVCNRDTDSSKYNEIRWTPRPGHADYTAEKRYGGYQDYRGGGRFSGRNTAGLVIAGALAKQLLKEHEVEVLAYSSQIGPVKLPQISIEEIRKYTESTPVRCPDAKTAERMIQAIEEAKAEGDSLGGKIKCIALNVPPGVGQPIFGTLEGDLARIFFAIPAVKAVEFGAGVRHSEMKGSESNDLFILEGKEVKTKSNNSGGIQGGISNGMPIECTLTMKPTPSIAIPQQTVNLEKNMERTIEVKGRHDPCIVPRAIPVAEAAMAIVLADHFLQVGIIQKVKENQR